jgi:hypothetical protein
MERGQAVQSEDGGGQTVTRQVSFDDDLTVWTIYERPADFPEGFVVRPWTVKRGQSVPGAAYVARTLEDAREAVPAGLYRMDRDVNDDPRIVETWI